MSRLIVIAVLSALTLLASPGVAKPPAKATPRVVVEHGKLPFGSQVEVMLGETVNTASAEVRRPVRFVLAKDILVDGTTIAKAGTAAKGLVVKASGKGWGGMPGTVAVRLTEIPLIGHPPMKVLCEASDVGPSKDASTVELLTGISLLRKGGNAVLAKGHRIRCEIRDGKWVERFEDGN